MNKPNHNPVISLCMIVKNEAEHLANCLESVQEVVDEIIVVDTGSTDSTIQIANHYGAKVITFLWNSDFAAARNIGIAQAKGTWILILDADEELDHDSKEELKLCAKHVEYEGFFVRIHNHIGKDKSTPTATVNPILRMFRNRPEHLFRGIIHEQIAPAITEYHPNAALHLSTIIIHHYGYADQTVIEKDKIQRNVTLLAKELLRSPNDPFQHFNMAVECIRLGEYQNALIHIHKSMELVVSDTSYDHLLHKYEIRCQYALGKVDEALRCCNHAIILFPDYTDLFHLKGAILFANRKLHKAKSVLIQAVELGPAPTHYHTETGLGTYLSCNMLGQIAEEIGHDTEAISWYTKSALFQRDWVQTSNRIFRVLKCLDQEQDIPEFLNNHLSVQVQNPKMRRKIIQWLALDGSYQAAETLASQLEKTDEFNASWRSLISSNQLHISDINQEVLALGIPYAYQFGQEAKAFDLLRQWELRYQNETRTTPVQSHSTEEIQDGIFDPMQISESVINEAYHLGCTWTALADTLLSRTEPTSPHFSAIHRVRLLLPLPRSK
ncbi:tetratricopeptide repeat-containing glycosyltransferase family 2 protein [Paenibacillus glacialis]|uniref:Glycosyltransferase 2-like domain-containing protein n=1 Tax=Paenibacillus glacialis TaxID=494026 RepID=A0A168H7H2_9BACL|nr:glycosyltransferase [Paenibacillus glacialis]OAB37899.1 hypothetical protein PGLA_20460 [Paenibacillus glacialis]